MNTKFIAPLYYLLFLLVIGTIGFYALKNIYSPEAQDITLFDSLYYCVISLTTVGYGDNLDLLNLPEPGKTLGIIFTVFVPACRIRGYFMGIFKVFC